MRQLAAPRQHFGSFRIAWSRHREPVLAIGFIGLNFLIQQLNRRARAKQKQQLTAQTQVWHSESESEPIAWNVRASNVRQSVAEEDQLRLLDECLPLSIRQLWDLIYDEAFQQGLHDKVQDWGCQMGSWSRSGEELVRRKQYYHPLKKNALGPREAFTEEESSCSRRDAEQFCVTTSAYTRSVPYGGSFHVELYWTATSDQSNSGTRLRVVGGIVFHKKILLRTFIKKATAEGLQESYATYKRHLWDHIHSNKLNYRGNVDSEVEPLSLDRTPSKLAAEDLMKNGIFVSWWRVLQFMLIIYLLQYLIRLANSQKLLAPAF